MPSKTTNPRPRTLQRDILPPPAFQVLSPSERRTVASILHRRNPCIDCDFVGSDPRDLKQHYNTRSKHSYVPDGPKPPCLLCGKCFCTAQALAGHHGVEHRAGGVFDRVRRGVAKGVGKSVSGVGVAKVSPAAVLQPGEARRTASTVRKVSATPPPTSIRVQGLFTPPPSHLPPLWPEVKWPQEMCLTTDLPLQPQVGAELLETRSPFFGAGLLKDAIRTENLVSSRNQPSQHLNQHWPPTQPGAHPPHACNSEPVDDAVVERLLLAFLHPDDDDGEELSEDAPLGYHTADPSKTSPCSIVKQVNEIAAIKRLGKDREQPMEESEFLSQPIPGMLPELTFDFGSPKLSEPTAPVDTNKLKFANLWALQ